MAQKNTLINYFGSPVSKKKLNLEETCLSSPGNKLEKSTWKDKSPVSSKKKTILNNPKVYEVVWSKLDGYPWWPSIVCNHPKQLSHVKGNEIHVQFFDNPPSRAWIKKRFVEAYTSSADKPVPMKDSDKWKKATAEADKAVMLSSAERQALIVTFSTEEPESDVDDADNNEGDSPSTDMGKENIQQSPPNKKRRILVLDSEDSGDDYKPGKEDMEIQSESASSGIDSGTEVAVSNADQFPLKKHKHEKSERTLNKAKNNAANPATTAKSTTFPSGEKKHKHEKSERTLNKAKNNAANPATTAKSTTFPSGENFKPQDAGHKTDGSLESCSHLKPDKIHDAKKRKPDNPKYDPKTLFIPDDLRRNLTPKKHKHEKSERTLNKAKNNAANPATTAKSTTFPSGENFKPQDAGHKTDGSLESWSHLKLDFLKRDKIHDAKKRKPDNPKYDPKMPLIPDDLRRNLTPNKHKHEKSNITLKKEKNNAANPATTAKSTTFPSGENFKPQDAGHKTDGSLESWSHLKLDFLKPDKIHDAKKRKPDNPKYDPKTLFLPDDFKRNLSPAMKQWWEMKATHFDCVLFFKVGKFYELYHMDAVIGVRELGLLFMKGENAHSGFPEISYGRFSTSLVEKGFKIARVEQTETPDMMAERCKGMFRVTKFDKVVKREICQITTRGTRTFSVLDGDAREVEIHYLLALTEQAIDMTTSSYGVCFIDTSIGVFHLGQFTDDRFSSHLRTLLAHCPPVQILFEKGALSERTQKLLGTALPSALKEPLVSGSEFWSAEKTLVVLAEGGYFVSAGTSWPKELKRFLSDADSLGLTPKDGCELAVRALGAVIWYLQQCHLEQQLLAMGRFAEFQPTDVAQSIQLRAGTLPKHMVLDGITLNNLEVLESSSGDKGTLLQRLDFCCTPFGKRLLWQWVCSPLCDTAAIKCRQRAISELMQNATLMKDARGYLSTLPDLERLLSRIHAQGNIVRSKTHPDSRAIFYEDRIYSKRKILDFTSTLNGFKCANKIVSMFQDDEVAVTSKLLLQCTSRFPDVGSALQFFDRAFDHDEAQKEGRIIPSLGVDPEYDAITGELSQVQTELAEYLKKQERFFGCKVTYVGSDKKRFQLEVPDGAAKRAGHEYELQSQRKGYKRYWTKQTKDLLARLIVAEEHRKTVLKDLSRRIFQQFSVHCDQWNKAVQCLSVLDVLLSLAEYARSEQGDMCVPKIVPPTLDKKPFIDIRGGRHPCISSMEGFIPNDTSIGCGGNASLMLVTGPNMGGKSTLMRQLGLLVLMAQMGCPIPATSCQLSPVDRIFTRLGASDDIMAGESTFFVELSETSAIFHQATSHSLVLVDELGRGTSTYDGTAIAASVVEELARLSCRTLFSTHYHTLVEDFRTSSQVTMGHMACMVENDGEREGDPSQETVTFLYKFAAGACPKSYGFNAALLGGIPMHITQRAYSKAVQLEGEGSIRSCFYHLCSQPCSTLLTHLKAS